MRAIFLRQWFLLGLIVVLAAGLGAPKLFASLADAAPIRNAVVAVVLFVTALPLETRVMWRALRRPWAALLAVLLNFAALPLLAWLVAPLLGGDLGVGLIVTAATPSTLASAAVWTRRAGGNDAVAILVTVITNLTCFLVTPLWLIATTGKANVQIDLTQMVATLGLLVVLPMMAGQLLRQRRRWGRWATQHKLALAVVAQMGILTMVFMGAIKCGLQLSNTQWQDQVSPWGFGMMGIIVVGVHLAVLLAGHAAGGLLGMGRPERIAIGFAGSQKTLMVGLHVALTYYGGLTVLPIVAYHVGQLLVDTFIADHLRGHKDDASSADRENHDATEAIDPR